MNLKNKDSRPDLSDLEYLEEDKNIVMVAANFEEAVFDKNPNLLLPEVKEFVRPKSRYTKRLGAV